MALPPNIASPTLVTGKTNQSQVVDIYQNNAAVKDGAAQNSISSVLKGATHSLFGDAKESLSKLLDSKEFKHDMKNLLKKAIRGDLNSSAIKETLKGYKNGALSSILEANGIKDGELLRKNIIDNVKSNVKGIAFGSVKGVVDNIAPGILDKVGIKSFDDCKNIYEQTANEIRSLKDLNSHDVRAFIADNLELTLEVSSTVLDNCVEVINVILEPEERITDISDANIDKAILVSATEPLIEEDNAVMNGYILDSFGNDKKKLKDYLNVMLPKAVEKGAYRFINKAAEKIDQAEVAWVTVSSPEQFLPNVVINPLPKDTQSRNRVQEEIISCLEIACWDSRENFNVGSFKGITDSVYEVLKYGPYAEKAAMARNTKPFTVKQSIGMDLKDFDIQF